MLKVGVLALATLTILTGCTWFGAKDNTAAKEAVRTAISNSFKVKSESYDVLLDGSVTPAKDAKAQFQEAKGNADFSGVYDTRVKENPKFTLKADVKGTIDGGKEQSVAGEMRLSDKNFYFSVSKFSVDGVPDIYKAAITQFMNKWWVIALPPESFASLSNSSVDDKDLTPQQKQIRDLIAKTDFFKNITDEGADKVGDVTAEKYSVELDKVALKNYVTEVAKINGQTTQQTDLDQFDKLMALVDFKGNVWVSGDDKMLRKAEGQLVISAGVETGNMAMNLKAAYTVGDLNKDVKVEVPAGAEKFDLNKMLGAPAVPTK